MRNIGKSLYWYFMYNDGESTFKVVSMGYTCFQFTIYNFNRYTTYYIYLSFLI